MAVSQLGFKWFVSGNLGIIIRLSSKRSCSPYLIISLVAPFKVTQWVIATLLCTFPGTACYVLGTRSIQLDARTRWSASVMSILFGLTTCFVDQRLFLVGTFKHLLSRLSNLLGMILKLKFICFNWFTKQMKGILGNKIRAEPSRWFRWLAVTVLPSSSFGSTVTCQKSGGFPHMFFQVKSLFETTNLCVSKWSWSFPRMFCLLLGSNVAKSLAIV